MSAASPTPPADTGTPPVPAGSAAPGRSRRLGTGFGKLWTASTTSAIGDGVSLTAAPLMASTLTGDPRLIAGVTMALTLPYAIFGIPAGVLVDRVDLRRAMARTDFFRGAAVTAFAVFVALGRSDLLALYLCFFLIGTCETFFRNASQVLVPSVVTGELLVEANGRLLGAQTASNQFVGPLLGSALFALTPAVPFATDAATFFVSATLLTSLRLNRPAATTAPAPAAGEAEPAKSGPGLLADMATGARWLVRHPVLRTLALTAGAINLVVTGGMAVLVVHAHTILRLGDVGYGVLMACQAVGAVVAARVSPLLTRWTGPERALVCVAGAIGLSELTIWLLPSAWAAGAGLALIACAGVTWDVVVVVLRQTLIPRHLQGRVNSVYRLLAWGAMPVGAGLAGLLSKAEGTPRVFAAGAVLMSLIALRLLLAARAPWLSGKGVED